MRLVSVVLFFICSPFFKCCFFVDYDWMIVDYQHHDLQYKVSVIVDLLPVGRARTTCEMTVKKIDFRRLEDVGSLVCYKKERLLRVGAEDAHLTFNQFSLNGSTSFQRSTNTGKIFQVDLLSLSLSNSNLVEHLHCRIPTCEKAKKLVSKT